MVFNKAAVAGLIAVCAAVCPGARARAESKPRDRAIPVMFRDGADQVQAVRGEGRRGSLGPVTLQMRGRVGHAWIGRRAILQLAASVNRDAAAWMRAQRISAVRFATDAPLTAAEAVGGPLATREAASPPIALNPRLRLYLVESGDRTEDGLALAARLSKVAGVESAIPDLHYERRAAKFAVPPNDPRYAGQWYLDHLQIERAWQVATGSPETSVVVVDDGCDLQHPDLAAAYAGGLDVIDDDDDPSYSPNLKGNEHGTACSGIIAAVGNNELGISGVCPTCSLRCVRLFDQTHSLIPISADVRAFNYAFDTDAAVVSNSWGFAEPEPVPNLVRLAIAEVIDRGRGGKGALVVFAAGNENREIDDSEIGAIPGVLNVGAINFYDEAAPFSNYGNSLDLTAPTGTLTTDISGPDGENATDYTSLFGGTSSACPVVAGVAALVMTAAPDKSALEVGEALMNSARKAPFAQPDANGHDPIYGKGIVDPSAALIALGVDVPELPEADRDAGESDGGDAKPHKSRKGDDDGGCNVLRVESDASLPLTAAGLATIRALRRRRRKHNRLT
jgi:serine protease